MGLLDCEKIPSPEKKPPVVVDLSEFSDGVTISFREPGMADLMPPTKTVKEIQVAFPEFSEEMIRPIVLLGKCYIRDANDPPEMAPARLLGKLAREKPKVFVRILTAFTEAFPDAFSGFDPKAGND